MAMRPPPPVPFALLVTLLAAAPATAQQAASPVRLQVQQTADRDQAAGTIVDIGSGAPRAVRVESEAVGNRLVIEAGRVERLDGRQTVTGRQTATTDVVLGVPLNGTLSVRSRAIGNLLVYDQRTGPPPGGVLIQESLATGIVQDATTRVRMDALASGAIDIGALAVANRVELPDRPDAIAPHVRQFARGTSRMTVEITGASGGRTIEQTTASNVATVGAPR